MNIKTLILSYEPLQNHEGKKPAAKRADEYFKELIGSFDLGEVYYGHFNNYKEEIEKVDPLIVLVPGDYYAHQIKDFKKDISIFIFESPSWVFYRKAEVENRKKEQVDVLENVQLIIAKLKSGELKEETVRNYAGMSYEDMYKMIQQAIISEDKELSKRAWDLLMDNNVHSQFIWMRANLVVDCWTSSDAQQKYEFLVLAMGDHVDNGFAVELSNFTDIEGLEYKQYEFIYPDGRRTGGIRRIPIPPKDMSPISYEDLLNKYETPNGARLLLEVGQLKSDWKEHTDIEAEKIFRVLKTWKEDPTKTLKELNIIDKNGEFLDEPMNEKDIKYFKNLLLKWAPDKYSELFGEEQVEVK